MTRIVARTAAGAMPLKEGRAVGESQATGRPATRRQVLAALAAAAASPPAAAAAEGLPFRRGVNINWWLALDANLEPSDGDLLDLRRQGFDHVRLPVDPYVLGWRLGDVGLPSRDAAARLEAAVGRILDAGLGLVLDLHAGEELVSVLRRRGDGLALVPLWAWLAERASLRDATRVAFEVANEPYRFIESARTLARFHEAALAEIRTRAPRHRVLVNGLWDPDLTLRTIDPLPFADVAYAFQVYEPYVVTHQGADWDYDPAIAPLRQVPWPAVLLDDPQSHVIDPARDHEALAALDDYSRAGWNAAALARRIGLAAAWGVEHCVPVHCTEFGVIRGYADQASRLRWLADARRALEALGIGWTVWELSGAFGVATGCPDDAIRTCGPVEPGVLRALGLPA
jgi:endoglucanase